MIRPIDTQTIYQQSQEVSNRQQAQKESLQVGQMQFGQLLQKEAQEKANTINNVEKNYAIDNDLSKNKNNSKGKQSKGKSNGKRAKDEKKMGIKTKHHFDQKV